MKISLVTETYWPDINGVAMTLSRVFSALSQQGHSVQLVCTKNPERSHEHTSDFDSVVEARSFPAPGYAEVRLGLPMNHRLAQLWQANRPDVIYVATEGPLGYFTTQLARKMNIPIASGFHTNFHNYSEHYSLGVLSKLVESYLVHMHNHTQCTITPTEDQSLMLQDLGINEVAVVGRGVDTSLFSPEKRCPDLRSQWGANDTTPVMIYVGRIAEEKNLQLTLRCYDLLKSLNPDLKFVMVGNGPAVERIRSSHPEVIMAGPKTGESLAKYYASADFFPFTSMTETYGNVILEAMASGIGIMSYHYAAGKIHIQQGVNGYHVPLGDEAAYLETVRKFIEEPTSLIKIRHAAALHAKQYNWPAIASGFLEVFSDLAMNQQALKQAS